MKIKRKVKNRYADESIISVTKTTNKKVKRLIRVDLKPLEEYEITNKGNTVDVKV